MFVIHAAQFVFFHGRKIFLGLIILYRVLSRPLQDFVCNCSCTRRSAWVHRSQKLWIASLYSDCSPLRQCWCVTRLSGAAGGLSLGSLRPAYSVLFMDFFKAPGRSVSWKLSGPSSPSAAGGSQNILCFLPK